MTSCYRGLLNKVLTKTANFAKVGKL